MERPEVAVEGVVQQRLVDAEVHRRQRLSAGGSGSCLRARRALRRRRVLLGVRERCVRIWCVGVRGEVESVLDVLERHRLSIRPGAHCFGLCCGAHLDDLTIAGRARARRLRYAYVRRHGEVSDADAWAAANKDWRLLAAASVGQHAGRRLGTKGRMGPAQCNCGGWRRCEAANAVAECFLSCSGPENE